MIGAGQEAAAQALVARQTAAAQALVLRAAYEALKREFERIEKMLNFSSSELLAKYLRKIRGAFDDRLTTASDELQMIRTQIEQIERGQPGDLEKAWAGYIQLRNEVLPVLANELLAIIGGAYLQERQLDSVRAPPADAPAAAEGGALSFSHQSQELVGLLNENSGFGWESVLIVGEEYFGHSEAEIIRLRFPACDLWNLPFTAHEYGYLVATNQKKAPKEFSELRAEVRRLVNPGNHTADDLTDDGLPKDKDCFIDDVRLLWEDYRGQSSDGARKQFLDREQTSIRALQDQQDNYLCRLFGDAFATFFLGPAYVHALLHLRFVPERLAGPSPYIPPFVHRLVVALETLKGMSVELGTNSYYRDLLTDDKPPFSREILDEASSGEGLAGLWRLTLGVVGQGDTYAATLARYRPWLTRFLTYLRPKRTGLRSTWENWKDALKLESYLRGASLSIPFKPSKLAILNAAWSARWIDPEAVPNITENVLRLLDPSEEKKWYAPGEQRTPQSGYLSTLKGGVEPTPTLTRNDRTAAVIEALAAPGYETLLLRFHAMQTGRVEPDVELMTALTELNRDALRHYIWLYSNLSS
jgi:hypothetical protein